MNISPDSYLVTGMNYNKNNFDNVLESAVKGHRNSSSQINWWALGKDLHCTVAYTTTKNQSIVDSKIIHIFSKAVKNEPHPKWTNVVGYEIANNGAVFLTLSNNKSLKNMHNEIIDEFSKQGLQPSPYSKQNYMAHVSIGKLAANADRFMAEAELKDVFFKVKQANPLFIIDQLELKKTNQTAKTVQSLKTVILN